MGETIKVMTSEECVAISIILMKVYTEAIRKKWNRKVCKQSILLWEV